MGISTAIPSDTMYNKIRKLQQAIDEAKAFCEDRGEAIQRLGEMITGLRQLDAQFGGNQYIHQLNNAVCINFDFTNCLTIGKFL